MLQLLRWRRAKASLRRSTCTRAVPRACRTATTSFVEPTFSDVKLVREDDAKTGRESGKKSSSAATSCRSWSRRLPGAGPSPRRLGFGESRDLAFTMLLPCKICSARLDERSGEWAPPSSGGGAGRNSRLHSTPAASGRSTIRRASRSWHDGLQSSSGAFAEHRGPSHVYTPGWLDPHAWDSDWWRRVSRSCR